MEQTASWNAGYCLVCGSLVKSWEGGYQELHWQCQNRDCENNREEESFLPPRWVH